MYWEKEKECLPRPDLEKLQLERLKHTLKRVGTNVPFYRNKFNELKIDPEKITSLDDLRRYHFLKAEPAIVAPHHLDQPVQDHCALGMEERHGRRQWMEGEQIEVFS